MNKTITLITGGIVTITLSIFLILGKIDLTTFGTLTTAILGVVYGFYKKIETEEINIHLIGTKNTIKLLEINNNELKRDFNIVNTRLNELLDNLEQSKIKEIEVLKPEIVEALKEKVLKKSKPKTKQ